MEKAKAVAMMLVVSALMVLLLPIKYAGIVLVLSFADDIIALILFFIGVIILGKHRR